MKEIESWKNSQWVPNSKIGADLWDAHYFFGWAVFESIRTYNHTPFLLDEHIHRLFRSAKHAEIKLDMTTTELVSLIYETIEHNKKFFDKNEEYRIMVFVSPGYFAIYRDMGKQETIVTINVTTTSRYAQFVAPYIKDGVTGFISSQRQIPSRFLNPKIKSCSRLHYGIADSEAWNYGGAGVFPVMLDENSYIAESSGANIAFFKDDMMCLPKDKNILNGCTMKFIIKEFPISFHKDDWDVYDLLDSDGILFTSTFFGLLPCYRIVYRNKKHELTGRAKGHIANIMSEFSESVGVDINKQWNNWFYTYHIP